MSIRRRLKKSLLRISPAYRWLTQTNDALRANQAESHRDVANLSKQIGKIEVLIGDIESKIRVNHDDLSSGLNTQQEVLANYQQQLERLEQGLSTVLSSANFASLGRLSQPRNRPITCLFIVHNIEVWSAQKSIYDQMLNDSRFHPIVASCSRKYPSGSDFINEDVVHAKLELLGVPHIRLTHKDSFIDLAVIKRISPDIIFRQSIWDNDVPPAFDTEYLTFARLYSISYYSIPMTEAPSSYLDHDFSRAAQSNFVLNDAIKYDYDQHEQGTANVVATGHPKIDEIIATKPSWPLTTNNSFKVFWVAHHAIFNDWINFGLLPKIYKSMLRLAKEHTDIDFLFSPHPGFIGTFERLDRENKKLAQDLKKFFKDWRELSNTEIIEHGGGLAEMKASSMMIIDGTSMLADYQVLDKPILFLEREDHVPFNKFGQMMADGANTLHNFSYADIEEGVLRVKEGKTDRQAKQRGRNKAFLTKYKNATKNIVESIAADFY